MYCVNCGVKLADTEEQCPLCGVTAYHPDIKREEGEPLYPQNKLPAPQVSSRGAQIITTAVFLLPLIITFQCDLQINRAVTWSGYVIGALITAYVIFVLPYWFNKPNPVVFCVCNYVAIGLYLMYINLAAGGDWFLSFALPVTGYIGLLSTVVVTLLRYVRRGALYIVGGAFIALGCFMPLMEFLLCITFESIRFLGWSFYPLSALAVLGSTIIFLAINRRAREKMERKFFI